LGTLGAVDTLIGAETGSHSGDTTNTNAMDTDIADRDASEANAWG
jgi:hypothetical protein